MVLSLRVDEVEIGSALGAACKKAAILSGLNFSGWDVLLIKAASAAGHFHLANSHTADGT